MVRRFMPTLIFQKTISDYTEAELDILLRGMDDPQLQQHCRQRAQLFTWNSLIARIYGEGGKWL